MDSQLFHNDRGSGQSSNPGSGSYGDGNNNNNFDQHNTIRNSSFGLGNFGGIDHSSNINANTNANKYPNFSSNDFPALGAGGNVNSNDNTNNNGIVGGSNSNNNNSSSSSSSSSSSNNNMNNNGGSLGVGTFGARRGVNGDYTTDNKDFSMMADDFPSLHTSLSGSGNSSGNVNAPTDDVLKLSGGYHEKIIKNQGGGIISSSNSNNSISNSTMMDKNNNNNNNNNKLIGQFGNIHSQGDNSKNNNGSDDSNGNNNNLMQNNLYNLLGLLSVIEMTDNDINLLMLGSDLTTYGLNLNSADVLYPSFSSPFNDQASIGAQYVTPKCYHMPISLFRFEHLSKLQLETLFYMFYAMPRDILQAHAAKELYRRDWKYHGELRVWLKPRPPQELAAATTEGAYPVPFMYFDANIFETKPFTATYRGNIASGLLSEEEVKAISVPSK